VYTTPRAESLAFYTTPACELRPLLLRYGLASYLWEKLRAGLAVVLTNRWQQAKGHLAKMHRKNKKTKNKKIYK